MKTRYSFRVLLILLVCAALLTPRPADAQPTAQAQMQMQNVIYTPADSDATIVWLSGWELEASGAVFDSLAGQAHDYQSALWTLGTPATVQADAILGVSSAYGQVQIGSSGDLNQVSLNAGFTLNPSPGAASFSAFAGATAYREFEITGGSGLVDVTFSFDYSGQLQAMANAGLLATAALRISDGTDVKDLMATEQLNDLGTLNFSGTESGSFTLIYNTPYSIGLSKDDEQTPEPSAGSIIMVGFLAAMLFRLRLSRTRAFVLGHAASQNLRILFLVLGPALCLAPQLARGYIPPPDPPPCATCSLCGSSPCCVQAGSSLNLVRGSMEDSYDVVELKSGGRTVLGLSLTYSSARAYDQAMIAGETSLGFGWAHSWGSFLFLQQGMLFRRGPTGAIAKFNRIPATSPALYKAMPGYFETITGNPDGTFTMVYKDGSTERFQMFTNCPYFFKSSIYQLTEQTDARGNTNQLAYDSLGRLAAVTDSYGRIVTFAYGATADDTNRITAITDPLGHVTHFAYAELGAKLVNITDPAGNTVSYNYDTSYRVTSKTDKLGHTYLYTYGPGTVTAQLVRADGTNVSQLPLVSLGNTNNWAVDPAVLNATLTALYVPSSVARTDSRGNLWTHGYDTNGSITSSTAPDGGVQSFTYDPSTLQKTSLTDVYGRTTYRQYDALGNLLAETNCLGQVTRYTYETNFNQVTSITDPNGFVTTNLYDAHGNLIKQTDQLGFSQEWTYDAHGNVLTEQDKNGNITCHYYDQFGNCTNTTDALGNVTAFSYDALGNLLSRTDANLHLSTFTYDAMNRLIAVTNGLPAPDPQSTPNVVSVPQLAITAQPDGSFLLQWTASGMILTRTRDLSQPFEDVLAGGLPVTNSPLQISAPLTNACEFYRLRASTGTLVPGGGGSAKASSQDPPGPQVTLYTYDADGNTTSQTDANGNITYYAYDEKGRPTYTTNALGGVTSNTYDLEENRLTKTDANGNITWYSYDSQNRPIYTTNALGYLTAGAYDLVGNKIAETDANGNTTWHAYDCLDRLTATTNALGYVTQYEYDAGLGGGGCGCGAGTKGTDRIVKLTDANGKVTYSKYDPLGRLLKTIRKQGDTADVIGPNDAVTTYTYDPNGNRLTMTDPNNITNFYGYDALNRQTAMTNGAGDITLNTYDPVGQLLTTTAPNGNITTNTHDSLNHLIQVDDAIGRVASYSYDAVGNRLSQTDGNGNTTSYAYDALNRLIRQTDAMGVSSTSFYDPVGNLLRSIDRNGNVTGVAYDALNRKTAQTNALGFVTRYTFDGVGNTVALTDANTNSTTFAYDAANRLIQKTYPDTPSDTVLYSYDGVGNLLSRTDQKGVTTVYRYNDVNLLTNRHYPVDPDDNFTFDLGGRMLTAEKGGWLVTYSYDGANRLTNTTQNGQTVAYTYDVPGRMRTLVYPGGRVITEYTDARSRLARIDDTNSPPAIAAFTYDAGGRLVARTNRNGTAASYGYNANNWIVNVSQRLGLTLIAGFAYGYDNEEHKQYEQKLQALADSETYGYDATYQLTDCQVGPPGGPPVVEETWNLDPVGNWNTVVSNGVPQIRTHNAANQLVTISGAPLAYDANGNLAEDTAYRYAWDQENRLAAVTRKSDNQVVCRYQYDALGLRTVKIATPNGMTNETRLFLDNERPIEEQDASGYTQATYVYGKDVDEVLTMDRSGQTYCYHQNALGSVTAVSDSAGNAVERYAYDAYGGPTITDGAGNPVALNSWGTPHSVIGNPTMFTGRQLDEETGFFFYRARYYDCAKGRFLQRDMLGYPDGPNAYAYVQNDPVNHTDPFGLQWCKNFIFIDKSPVRYQAPNIKSGSLCRGACGPDCPSTCNTGPYPAGVAVLYQDPKNHSQWFECDFTPIIRCGSAEGCRVHDRCFDWCYIHNSSWNTIIDCKQDCNERAVQKYGWKCTSSWMSGGGPYEEWLNFWSGSQFPEPKKRCAKNDGRPPVLDNRQFIAIPVTDYNEYVSNPYTPDWPPVPPK